MINFTLTDAATGDKIDGDIVITPGAIGIRIDGYGDKGSAPGEGEPIYLEYYGGKLVLRAWADITGEDATHVIDLEGAKEDKREPE